MQRMGAAFVGLLLVASGAVAQEPPRPTLADVERAHDALDEAQAAANLARVEATRTSRAANPSETDIAFGTAGPFRVIAAAPRLADAEAAVLEAWSKLEPYVGDPRAAFQENAILVRWSGDAPIDVARVARDFEPWSVLVRRGLFAHLDAAEAVGRELSSQLGQILRIRRLGRIQEEWVYRALMVSPAVVVGECLAGDPSACWGALGIGTEDPDWKAWVRPSEYSNILARIPRDQVPDRLQVERERCITSGLDAVCESFLSGLPPDLLRPLIPVPLPIDLSMDLLAFAMETGGRGSFERLAPGLDRDLRARMVDASQTDPDELILAWVDEAIGRGVDRGPDSRRRRSSALLWYVLFMIPAARGTRWRLS